MTSEQGGLPSKRQMKIKNNPPSCLVSRVFRKLRMFGNFGFISSGKVIFTLFQKKNTVSRWGAQGAILSESLVPHLVQQFCSCRTLHSCAFLEALHSPMTKSLLSSVGSQEEYILEITVLSPAWPRKADTWSQ
jgi:hypothetical protein